MNPEPKPEHAWLNRLVGEWTAQIECPAGPGQPPTTSEMTETVSALGGLWVLSEGRGESPSGEVSHSRMTLGYDPRLGQFVGTFIASVMTHLWIYHGHLDADQRILTLDTEGPDFTGDVSKLVKYQDIIEIVDDNHRILRSQALGDDGQWHQFMIAHYHRKA